jgi:hypothetical protein
MPRSESYPPGVEKGSPAMPGPTIEAEPQQPRGSGSVVLNSSTNWGYLPESSQDRGEMRAHGRTGWNRTLRRAVTVLLCLVMSNVLVIVGHAHAAHSVVDHAHNLQTIDKDAGKATIDIAHTGHHHSGSSDGAPPCAASCGHAHCCVAIAISAACVTVAALTDPGHPRPVDERMSGRTITPSERPPSIIL